jgi:hypothetical protein
MTPAMRDLYQFEAEAVTMRYFNNLLIPGPLQTPAYAEAVFASYPQLWDSATVAARIASRERRRQRVLRPGGPQYLVLLDESVLSRERGGPSVMVEQFGQLRDMTAEDRIQLRLIPLAGRLIFQIGPFVLVDLEEGKSAVLYRETAEGDEIIHDPSAVQGHRKRFDQMWNTALDEESSLERITDRMAQLST